jgi:hypothetical protein
MLRSIWFLVLCLVAPLAQAAGDAEAINLAGQQRMLSQRIVKSWCQIGLNVQPALSKRQLDESLRRFEENLKALDGAAAGSEARGALAGLRAAWAPLRGGAGVIRQSDAAQLDARAEDDADGGGAAHPSCRTRRPCRSAAGSTGRAPACSRSAWSGPMLQQWQVSSATLRDETERVQNEFAGALASMQKRADNSQDLRTELDNLALQWEWLQTVLATEGAVSFRLIMAEGGEAILELADRITLLYLLSAK